MLKFCLLIDKLWEKKRIFNSYLWLLLQYSNSSKSFCYYSQKSKILDNIKLIKHFKRYFKSSFFNEKSI